MPNPYSYIYIYHVHIRINNECYTGIHKTVCVLKFMFRIQSVKINLRQWKRFVHARKCWMLAVLRMILTLEDTGYEFARHKPCTPSNNFEFVWIDMFDISPVLNHMPEHVKLLICLDSLILVIIQMSLQYLNCFSTFSLPCLFVHLITFVPNWVREEDKGKDSTYMSAAMHSPCTYIWLVGWLVEVWKLLFN